MGCNRGTNIIVIRPFYAAEMENLDDDKLHLQALVWPLLEKLSQSKDVPKFCKQYRRDMADARITMKKLIETKAEREVADAVQGEGTYEPRSSYGNSVPLPCLQTHI